MNILVSIIIPCYNHGEFIEEAINSIKIQDLPWPIELIIVDDGSTIDTTINCLNKLEEREYRVLWQENKGLATARNNGIREAKGKYILPLDADNKITKEYLLKAIPILETDMYDIVYAKPIFFGNNIKSRKFKVRKYDELAIVTGNFADACAIFRKDVWIINNGYDTSIPYPGFEDWEFWINAAKNNFRFYFLKEKLYYYRISGSSMIAQYANEHKKVLNHRYLVKKHADFFLEKTVKLAYIRERYEIDFMRFLITPIIYPLYLLGVLKNPIRKAKDRFQEYKT